MIKNKSSYFNKLLLVILSVHIYVVCSDASGNELLICNGIVENDSRLDCGDARQEGNNISPVSQADEVAVSIPRSYLTSSWDLDNRDEEMLGEHQSSLKPHHISYIIVRKTGETNQQPSSPSQGAFTLPVDMQVTEVKFQYSQKARLLNALHMNLLGIKSFRFWGAYTQQSSWQAFNHGNSSPFRETNYEPELIATLGTGNASGLKLINVGYAHQSNGNSLLLSRSWNRLYMQGGWESETMSLLVRKWWRIPEDISQDDNPDIEEYYGHGDISLRWEPLDHSQVVDLLIRNNFNAERNRGFVQIDWASPVSVSKSTKLHIQLTSGYGESLIDYNFFQTTLGFGFSFRNW